MGASESKTDGIDVDVDVADAPVDKTPTPTGSTLSEVARGHGGGRVAVRGGGRRAGRRTRLPLVPPSRCLRTPHASPLAQRARKAETGPDAVL